MKDHDVIRTAPLVDGRALLKPVIEIKIDLECAECGGELAGIYSPDDSAYRIVVAVCDCQKVKSCKNCTTFPECPGCINHSKWTGKYE